MRAPSPFVASSLLSWLCLTLCSGGGNAAASSASAAAAAAVAAALSAADDDDDDDDLDDTLDGGGNGFGKAVREKERRQANNVRERYVMSTGCLPRLIN